MNSFSFQIKFYKTAATILFLITDYHKHLFHVISSMEDNWRQKDIEKYLWVKYCLKVNKQAKSVLKIRELS